MGITNCIMYFMKFTTKKRISDFIRVILVVMILGTSFSFQNNASSKIGKEEVISTNLSKIETNDYEKLEYKTISEIKDKEIGILTGTVYDGITKEILPDTDYQYFSNISDLTQALLTKKN